MVMLSFPFWQRYFGEEASILGDEVTVDGVPHTVIGVVPEDFGFIPANVDVYRTTDWTESFRRDERDTRSLLVMGRLVEGRGIEEAQAELETEYPDANAGYGVHAIVLRDLFPGPTDTMLMYILMTVAGFVLLIACANIANLLLARAEGRQREIAVRTAMGAGRARILRQLLTESVHFGRGLAVPPLIAAVRWVRNELL